VAVRRGRHRAYMILSLAGFRAYLADNMNKLDFLIVVVSIVDLARGDSNRFAAFRVARVLR
jgi:hypothetical protein